MRLQRFHSFLAVFLRFWSLLLLLAARCLATSYLTGHVAFLAGRSDTKKRAYVKNYVKGKKERSFLSLSKQLSLCLGSGGQSVTIIYLSKSTKTTL